LGCRPFGVATLAPALDELLIGTGVTRPDLL
jgi:hypothetical protein